jgi:kynureninase
VGSPRDAIRRGAHVALTHPQAWPVCRALIERAGVIPDFRPPDRLRLGVAPLYTTYTEVFDAVERIAAVVERGEHEAMGAAPSRVT